jgi:hypothetical protein
MRSKIVITIHKHCIDNAFDNDEIWCKCGEFFSSYILHADHVAMMVLDAVEDWDRGILDDAT